MTPKVNWKLGFERREITFVKLKYELFIKHNMKHQKTFPPFKGVRKKGGKLDPKLFNRVFVSIEML